MKPLGAVADTVIRDWPVIQKILVHSHCSSLPSCDGWYLAVLALAGEGKSWTHMKTYFEHFVHHIGLSLTWSHLVPTN